MPVTFDTGQYTVSATAGILAPANFQRTALLIVNTSGVAFYVGNSAVSTANGHFVPGVIGASITIPTQDAVYAVTSSSTALVTYTESYPSR